MSFSCVMGGPVLLVYNSCGRLGPRRLHAHPPDPTLTAEPGGLHRVPGPTLMAELRQLADWVVHLHAALLIIPAKGNDEKKKEFKRLSWGTVTLICCYCSNNRATPKILSTF